jgi:thiamine biosynthesis protein ThiS
VNDCVVRRSAFASRALAEGDAVEIIRAVAGG